jgi:hypothetical protein
MARMISETDRIASDKVLARAAWRLIPWIA